MKKGRGQLHTSALTQTPFVVKAWRWTPVILPLAKLKQEDSEF